MPTDTKHDPFKPHQPAIPGVPAADASKTKARPVAPPRAVVAPVAAKPAPPPVAADERRQQMIAIGACLVACLLVAGMIIAWKVHQPAPSTDAAAAAVPSPAAELAEPPKPAANLPVAPGVVATEEELAKPWSSKRFTYRDPMLDTDVPAMVVRLPRGGYWAFSLIEPFGTCELEYVTNLQRLQSVYDFQSDHPLVGDPCNHAVFDLLQWGGPPSAEVRGAPVKGMGVRPPLAIEIVQRGKEILATKIE